MFDIKKWLGLSNYISEADQFLVKLRKTPTQPTASQQAEQNKYSRISSLRDSGTELPNTTDIWDKF